MNKKFLLYFISFLFLYSCQGIKDGLTGKKQENSDEFLVIKKNPLEIPPDFDKLPIPKGKKTDDDVQAMDKEIENLIKSISSDKKNKSSSNKNAEEFVINEINKN